MSLTDSRDRSASTINAMPSRAIGRYLAYTVEESLDGEKTIGIVSEFLGPVPLGSLVFHKAPTSGDDGLHQLEDGGLER